VAEKAEEVVIRDISSGTQIPAVAVRGLNQGRVVCGAWRSIYRYPVV
jgi:hypothetical protein